MHPQDFLVPPIKSELLVSAMFPQSHLHSLNTEDISVLACQGH